MARGNAKSIGLSPWKTPLEVAFIKAGQAEVFAAILADQKKEASFVPEELDDLNYKKEKNFVIYAATKLADM